MPLNTPLKTIAIAALSALAATSVATAAPLDDHVGLAYKTSDLRSANAIQSLYKRIESKAGSACNVNDARALYAKKAAAECQADLIEDWVAGIGDSRLQQEHAQAKGARSYASLR